MKVYNFAATQHTKGWKPTKGLCL